MTAPMTASATDGPLENEELQKDTTTEPRTEQQKQLRTLRIHAR